MEPWPVGSDAFKDKVECNNGSFTKTFGRTFDPSNLDRHVVSSGAEAEGGLGEVSILTCVTVNQTCFVTQQMKPAPESNAWPNAFPNSPYVSMIV